MTGEGVGNGAEDRLKGSTEGRLKGSVEDRLKGSTEDIGEC